MNAFFDIQILENQEIPTSTILNQVFETFHKNLVRVGIGDIAVSFPKYGDRLGSVLRVHATQDRLQALMNLHWLDQYADYVMVSEIKSIPADCKYRTFFRVQKKSPQNIRKRAIKRGIMTESEARRLIPDSAQDFLSLPFISLTSASTGQRLCLYIATGDVQMLSQGGIFSSYGLSKTATVPWF